MISILIKLELPTLDFTATGLTTATSSGFTINPNTPVKLAFIQEPTDAVSLVNINLQSLLKFKMYDNVTTATDNLTLAFNNNAGAGTLNGTLTVAAVAGNAPSPISISTMLVLDTLSMLLVVVIHLILPLDLILPLHLQPKLSLFRTQRMQFQEQIFLLQSLLTYLMQVIT